MGFTAAPTWMMHDTWLCGIHRSRLSAWQEVEETNRWFCGNSADEARAKAAAALGKAVGDIRVVQVRSACAARNAQRSGRSIRRGRRACASSRQRQRLDSSMASLAAVGNEDKNVAERLR